jgi:hypothetical protein
MTKEFGQLDQNGRLTWVEQQTLRETVDGHTSQLAEIATNVKSFGAKGDGTTDDTTAIQNAINAVNTLGGGTVYLPAGTYKITGTLTVYGYVTIEGSNINTTTIQTSATTFNAFTVVSNARRTQIRNLHIVSSAGLGTSNAGIKIDDTQGGAEQLFYNLIIDGFYYGFKMKNDWWNSTLENVRFNACGYSFYGDGTDGQSINNLFIRCYSNQPTILGIYAQAVKNWTFLECNFGGHTTNQTQYIYLPSTCYNVRFIGCNFEQIIVPQNRGSIEIWSSSTVSITNCNFVNNNGASAYAYQIAARESSRVVIEGYYEYIPGTNIKQLMLNETAKVILVDGSITDVTHSVGTTAQTTVNDLSQPRIARTQTSLNLSGGAQTAFMLIPPTTGRVTGLRFIYTQASDSNAGVNITVKNQFDTIYSGNSLPNQSAFAVQQVSLNQTTMYANDPILVTTTGTKVGTGQIHAEITYVLD